MQYTTFMQCTKRAMKNKLAFCEFEQEAASSKSYKYYVVSSEFVYARASEARESQVRIASACSARSPGPQLSSLASPCLLSRHSQKLKFPRSLRKYSLTCDDCLSGADLVEIAMWSMCR